MDNVWVNFSAEDDVALDCVIELNAVNEYSLELQTQVNELITEIKVVIREVSTIELVTNRESNTVTGRIRLKLKMLF